MMVQSAALPYRMGAAGLEILLVTNTGQTKWIVPKGHRESFMEPHLSAAKEAWEEGGVTGHVESRAIGTWTYTKSGLVRRVDVFPLIVVETHDLWPEMSHRRRRWLPHRAAIDRASIPELKALIAALPEFLEYCGQVAPLRTTA